MYFTVKTKFIFAVSIASIWFMITLWLSLPWIRDLAAYITIVPAFILVASIALIPGFMYMFLNTLSIKENQNLSQGNTQELH